MTARPGRGGVAPSSRVLLFAAAGLPLGVPLEDMLRVAPEQDVLPMPLAHPALFGVMETLEGVSPVYDLGLLCGGRARTVAPGSGDPLVALFPHPLGSVGIRMDKLQGLAPEVVPLEQKLAKNMLAALPGAAQALCTGAATARGQLFFFFSKDAFLGWVASEAR